MADSRTAGSRVPNGWGDPSTERHLQVPPRHATGSRAATVEKMARALCKADGRDPDWMVAPHEHSTTRWEPFPTWEHYKPQAELVVEALDD